MEIQTILLRFVPVLASPFLAELGTEQHSSTMMFTTSIQQSVTRHSTSMWNCSGSWNL